MERIDWHARFLQQARWTRTLRVYLFAQARLDDSRRVLEVGCGTGAVLADLPHHLTVHGLDLNLARLSQARSHTPAARLTCGDARCLPYPSAAFDVTFCHYLLLWVSEPVRVLQEMKRVTRPGGSVLALAEPDYSARQDAPAALEPLGQMQNESLRRQGADISLGGRLADLFLRAGIKPIECGALAPAPFELPAPEEQEMEWAVLQADLADSLSSAEIQTYRSLDAQAWRDGTRRLYVPTFFAWGRV